MPRDSSGLYTLPIGNPVVTNTIISSVWANDTMGDIAAQLNNVITRDGLLGPVGPFRIADGTVAAPGLAFSSEPGLGWYRGATGSIYTASAGARTTALSAGSGTTFFNLTPRSAGGGVEIQLFTEPPTAVNNEYFALTKTTVGTNFSSTVQGTAVHTPFFFGGAINYQFDNTLLADFTVQIRGRANNSAGLLLNKGISTAENYVAGQLNGVTRWKLIMGDGAADQTLYLQRFNAAGVFGGNPIAIRNSDGFTTFDSTAGIQVIGPIVGNVTGTGGTGVFAGDTSFGLVFNGGFPYLRFTADNWRWQMTRSTGDISWINPVGASLFTVFGSGAISCTGNASINGGTVFLGGAGSNLTRIGLNFLDYTSQGGTTLFNNVISTNPQFQFFLATIHQVSVKAYWQFQSGSSAFSFENGGEATKSSGSPNWIVVSDRRSKENIVDAPVGLDQILSLKVRQFDRIREPDPQFPNVYYPSEVGLIADEAEATFPQLVKRGPGTFQGEEYDDWATLDSGPVTWALVNSVKKLHERISHLEARAQ